MGDADIGRIEENIVGDQRLAGADYGCPRGTHPLWTQIRLAVRIRGNCFLDALKLPAPDILQVFAVLADGGIFVEVDRNVQSLCHAFAEPPRHLDTFLHGDARDRHKWDDIGGAHARMFALVLVEVNQLRRLGDAKVCGFFHRFGRPDKGQDRAVVVHVGMPVQNAHSAHARDSSNDRIHHFRTAGFGKIRDAFNNFWGHSFSFNSDILLYPPTRESLRRTDDIESNNLTQRRALRGIACIIEKLFFPGMALL